MRREDEEHSEKTAGAGSDLEVEMAATPAADLQEIKHMKSTLNLTALVAGAEETARSIREEHPNASPREIAFRLVTQREIRTEAGPVAASCRPVPGGPVTIFLPASLIDPERLRAILHHLGLTLELEPATLSTTIDVEAVAFAQAKLAPVGEAFARIILAESA